MTFLRRGDVARLKSGGPEMTVISDDGDGVFTCQWFTDGSPQSGQYHKRTLLRKIRAEKPTPPTE
jgi:uncharacterized protein YodC (DUF2158 family)